MSDDQANLSCRERHDRARLLVIAYIIIGGLMRTHQVTTNKLGLAPWLIFLTCGVLGTHAFRRQRPATVAGGDAHP